MPYGQVDRLSKLIPVEGVKPVSIEKALADEPRLREEAKAEEVVARLLNYCQQVEGLLRNASTHAAGVLEGHVADTADLEHLADEVGLDTLRPLRASRGAAAAPRQQGQRNQQGDAGPHSHSIVAGGFDEMS